MIEPSVPAARVRIWDLPIRMFHWLLVLLIPFAWWTAEEEQLELHLLSGIAILALLLFRILWGLLGTDTARFTRFVKGPRAILDYVGGRARPAIGHNPIGALSVVALIGLLLVQVVLGLFAGDEDGLVSGPLAYLVGFDLSEELTELHEALFDVLLVLIGLHVAAILFYTFVKRQNLVGPMISGSGKAPAGTAGNGPVSAWRLGLALAVALLAAFWIYRGAPL